MPQREEPYLNGEENQGCLLEAICTPGNATPLDSSSSQSPMVRVPEMHSGGQSPSCFLGRFAHTLSPVPNPIIRGAEREHTPKHSQHTLLDRGRGAPFPGRHLQGWGAEKDPCHSQELLVRSTRVVSHDQQYHYANLDDEPMPEPRPLCCLTRASQHESQELNPGIE